VQPHVEISIYAKAANTSMEIPTLPDKSVSNNPIILGKKHFFL
jgi:hypothetical protein